MSLKEKSLQSAKCESVHLHGLQLLFGRSSVIANKATSDIMKNSGPVRRIAILLGKHAGVRASVTGMHAEPQSCNNISSSTVDRFLELAAKNHMLVANSWRVSFLQSAAITRSHVRGKGGSGVARARLDTLHHSHSRGKRLHVELLAMAGK